MTNDLARHSALVVMTIVAVLFFPVVLPYQGWSFHAFRRRVSASPAASEPAGGTGQMAAPT